VLLLLDLSFVSHRVRVPISRSRPRSSSMPWKTCTVHQMSYVFLYFCCKRCRRQHQNVKTMTKMLIRRTRFITKNTVLLDQNRGKPALSVVTRDNYVW